MRRGFYRSLRLALPLLLAGWAAMPLLKAFTPSEPGLYAVFVTSKGEFAAELYFDRVPLTVGNFVGLAEGTQIWWEGQDRELRMEPFYTGITFHRVIDGFVIQAGSPNGLGNDGPGYRFNDEIDFTLSHDGAGYLSMANAGVNTNGSQFFITLAAATSLDHKHAIFGKVVEGMEVVNAIGDVETNANDKPVEDVVIQSVTILRQGEAAQAFDAGAWQLPKQALGVDFAFSEEGATLLFDRSSAFFNDMSVGADLKEWTALDRLGPHADGSLEQRDITSIVGSANRAFVRSAGRDTPSSVSMTGARLTLTWPDNTLLIRFESAIDGSYQFNGNEGELQGYFWHEVGKMVQVHVGYEGGLAQFPMQIYFSLQEGNTGEMLAYAYSFQGAAPISTPGEFSFEPAE